MLPGGFPEFLIVGGQVIHSSGDRLPGNLIVGPEDLTLGPGNLIVAPRKPHSSPRIFHIWARKLLNFLGNPALNLELRRILNLLNTMACG